MNQVARRTFELRQLHKRKTVSSSISGFLIPFSIILTFGQRTEIFKSATETTMTYEGLPKAEAGHAGYTTNVVPPVSDPPKYDDSSSIGPRHSPELPCWKLLAHVFLSIIMLCAIFLAFDYGHVHFINGPRAQVAREQEQAKLQTAFQLGMKVIEEGIPLHVSSLFVNLPDLVPFGLVRTPYSLWHEIFLIMIH